MTTRYIENDFLSSMYSVLHETGHGIYEQGIGDDIAISLLGSGASMGIHESQSRFYENLIGRRRTFWEMIRSELTPYLSEAFDHVTPHLFYEAMNEVKPSLIRVESDELTYNLHIIIRYEIERILFTEEVDVYDLPKIWNEKYEEYLGITPPTDSVGILQDIHWAMGAFGYFPTYALGSAYATQILAHMEKDFDVEAAIATQKFDVIKEWLKEKVHRFGSTYTPNGLMEKSFGETFNADYYVRYLKEKFSKLYDLSE